MRAVVFILWLLFFAASALADGTAIVVVGAGGSPEYDREFATWADRWTTAAGRGSVRVVQVGRDDRQSNVGAATQPATTTVATDKQRLQNLLHAESNDPAQPLWLVLIGHGTSDGRDTNFNLRGPDVSDHELADWLRPMHRPIAIIDCSSASAPFVNRISAKGRVVITATRSGSEIQFAHFGDYLSSSIADPLADLDKDGQTSLLEAFIAASHRTEEFYKQAGRLATEHALLDDNGDGLGIAADWFQGVRATHAARDGAPIDGTRAHQWCLVPSDAERKIPAAIRARRDELELAIESLRQKKATMREADYYAQLETQLLQLARLYQQIEGGATPAVSP
jgi:hypothetical protein